MGSYLLAHVVAASLACSPQAQLFSESGVVIDDERRTWEVEGLHGGYRRVGPPPAGMDAAAADALDAQVGDLLARRAEVRSESTSVRKSVLSQSASCSRTAQRQARKQSPFPPTLPALCAPCACATGEEASAIWRSRRIAAARARACRAGQPQPHMALLAGARKNMWV